MIKAKLCMHTYKGNRQKVKDYQSFKKVFYSSNVCPAPVVFYEIRPLIKALNVYTFL